MKKIRIVGLLLILVMMSTLLEGCFRKGENDPFITFSSRKSRMSGVWDITEFTGDYLLKLNSGENRKVFLKQSGSSVSETTEYINMATATQDSLGAGQDTTIEWKGKLIEAFFDIRADGTFDYAFEYTLTMVHSTEYPDGDSLVGIYAPTTNHFTLDSTMKRNYRTEYRGRWNFLSNVDGMKNKERVIFEIENAAFVYNMATTFTYDFLEDDLPNNSDTSYSIQSLESENYKYANGEFSILWSLDKLKGSEATMMRELDYIYTHALTGFVGYKTTKKGNELIEMEQTK